MRPLVGVTAWRRTLETYYGPDNLHTLSARYMSSLAAAGITPVIFPAGLDPSEADQLVAKVDGVILSGGDDVDPAIYGAENNDSVRTDPDVDRFEIALVASARERAKPLLAICRGIQLLNVALGGTLRQEVTSEGGVHELISDDNEEMSSRRHVVRFEEGSLLAEIYGASEAKVNTLHHQGVGELSPELVVEGRTDDGLIEAARWPGDWWAVAVQWHPERLDGEHHLLFSAFREAIERG
ncbi:MAG TPA: gamma-glutamyl-gamma-aminobutyrate hydrolase family protein [Acidimicrobiia bacterium]|nr:gamma-glutamyl-gamma-aminobutyrate hydrolase family protein [Acidimicrobiia bacterium]